MSNYTLELRQACSNNVKELFNFPYNFYDEALKEQFEIKFLDHYFFDEIGFETIDRFKHRLRTRLNEIAPYYKQLYFTELESKKCNFMLNKDLKETFVRDVTNNAISNSVMNNDNTSNITSENLGYDSVTPEGSIEDIEKYMTNATKGNATNSTTAKDVNTANSTSEGTGKESTELISQGNIGITSSGQLLEDWRKILINIDQLIINECQDLFMMIY